MRKDQGTPSLKQGFFEKFYVSFCFCQFTHKKKIKKIEMNRGDWLFDKTGVKLLRGLKMMDTDAGTEWEGFDNDKENNP